jgi:hypothetical protein
MLMYNRDMKRSQAMRATGMSAARLKYRWRDQDIPYAWVVAVCLRNEASRLPHVRLSIPSYGYLGMLMLRMMEDTPQADPEV